MARSRKKFPVTGITCAESEKAFKAAEHRRERRNAKVRLAQSLDGDAPRLHRRPYGDPWTGPKDGKAWHRGPFAAKAVRK